MDSDKLFLGSLIDKQCSSRDKCIITCTKFLDLNQQSAFTSLPKDGEVIRFLYGGYAQAESKIGVFIPKVYGIEDENDFYSYDGGKPLGVLRIDKDKFSVLSHRDYLGAVMNCGIKRETVGDIIIDQNGAYIIAFEDICEHLKRELFRIGRGTVKVSCARFEDLEAFEAKTEDSFVTIASLRLDNVISAAFSLSRKKAVAEIAAGKVFINDVLVEKNDFKVPVGAKIVLRGKGKAMLSEQTGQSRKNRPQIIIKRYI